MTTIAVNRSVSGVLTSADSARLTITNASGAVVVDSVLVAPTSEGVYSYIATTLSPSVYTAEWTFIVADMADDVIYRVFQAEGPVQITPGVTLMDIEERIARRIGRYRKFKASPAGDVDTLMTTRLRSSIDMGDYEDLYILRRGVFWDGSQVENFTEDDRVRVVATYDHATGTLTPDESWLLPPQDNERIELHSLDPEQDLRPSVIQGLERCFFWEQASVAVTGALRQLPLSSSVPWLTDPASISELHGTQGNAIVPPVRTSWWKPYRIGGGLFLNTDWLAAGDLQITALRQHSTFVNGEYSPTGPNDDFDVLYVDPEYAARAAHVQLWLNCTDQMIVLAAQGLRLTPQQAADAFTHSSKMISEQAVEVIRIRYESDAVLTQVGNAPEVG